MGSITFAPCFFGDDSRFGLLGNADILCATRSSLFLTLTFIFLFRSSFFFPYPLHADRTSFFRLYRQQLSIRAKNLLYASNVENLTLICCSTMKDENTKILFSADEVAQVIIKFIMVLREKSFHCRNSSKKMYEIC